MRPVLFWLICFGLLFGLWLALVGGTSWNEQIGGLIAAAVAAAAAEIVRRQGLLSYRVPLGLLGGLLPVAWEVVRQFVLLQVVLLRALVTRRAPRGAFAAHSRDTGGDTPRGRGVRAFAGWLGSLAPNTVVVDVDRADGVLLEHHLVPTEASPDPLA
jgi:multisubunit Na+/H+ antiporter MnhE subunit